MLKLNQIKLAIGCEIMSNNGNSNVINVKTVMKENAFVKTRVGRLFMNISPESVQEMKTRIVDALVDNMPKIAERVYQDGRKTIMTKHYPGSKSDVCDITMHFGIVGNDVLADNKKYCIVEKNLGIYS